MALPSGYTPLEYIESTGTQYIDTGFKHNQNTRVVMDAQVTAKPSSHAWLFEGRINGVSNKGLFLLNGTTWNTDYVNGSDGRHAFASVGILDRLNVDYDKNVVNINGNTHTYPAATFQSTVNLVLFAANNAGSVVAHIPARIWVAQIYDNGTLIRDLIPCQTDSGEVGLYDDVNGVFYGDAAGVGFVAGPVAIYTELEYIESDGTQYIDTRIYANQDTGFSIDFTTNSPVATSGWGAILACISSTSNRFGIATYPDKTGGQFAYGDAMYDPAITTGIRCQISLLNGTITTSNGTVSVATKTFSVGATLTLFARNWAELGKAASNFSETTIYSCRIYDGDTLVRNYIPVQRLDGMVGLLDQVNNVFYPDAAGGNFIPGPLAAKPEAPAYLEVIGTTRNATVLAWPGAPVGQSYRLYRDGVVVYEGSSLCYTDAGLAAGSAHVYSVHTVIGSTESEGVTTEATTTEGIVLITDRTAADVSAGRRKGYYNALDLIRVGEAMAYLEECFAAVGISVTVSPKLDWQLSDIPTHALALHYLTDIGVLRGKLTEFRGTVSLPGSLTALTWASANDIETILLDVENLIHTIILSYRHYSGRTISGVNALP